MSESLQEKRLKLCLIIFMPSVYIAKQSKRGSPPAQTHIQWMSCGLSPELFPRLQWGQFKDMQDKDGPRYLAQEDRFSTIQPHPILATKIYIFALYGEWCKFSVSPSTNDTLISTLLYFSYPYWMNIKNPTLFHTSPPSTKISRY